MTSSSLAESIADVPGVRLRDTAQGITFVDVQTPLARASICLQGAQLMQWQPAHAPDPVLWVSELARPVRGKSLRGGAPVCWPWFGPAADGSGLPAHGIARNLDWDLAGVAADGVGVIELRLRLDGNAVQRGARQGNIAPEWGAAWPEGGELELRCRIGGTLALDLETRNHAGRPLVLGEALHTYFQVGDIEAIRIEGLQGRHFDDRLQPGASPEQQGAVRFDGEVDRVYADPGPHADIVDPVLGRTLRVRKRGSGSTVVWSPGADKAARLGDIAPAQGPGQGWRGFVCVETANALGAVVHVAPGAGHVLGLEVQVLVREDR